jgi:hypothetical protein
MDDLIAMTTPKYHWREWEDVSFTLQECYFAKKFFDRGKTEEQSGTMCVWDVQFDYEDNFRPTAAYDADESSRKNTMIQGKMGWAFQKTNYQYDILEDLLNKSDEQIIRWLDVKEHSLDNSFYYGMDKMMFGTGPTSITQDRPPSASLLWWLPPYNTNTGQANNPSVLQLGSGVTNDFVGGDPAGFSAIGAGGIVSANYKGWRHRVGSYTVFNEDDAIDTIVECMDKCHFTPAQSYSQIVSETSPRWDLIAPYSRIKLARKISVSQNDNFRGDVAKWKDTALIRGVPLQIAWQWTNQDTGNARTDGLVMGIHWPSVSMYQNASWNKVKIGPVRDPRTHTVRWRFLDNSMQMVFKNRRTSFCVNSSVPVTESN